MRDKILQPLIFIFSVATLAQLSHAQQQPLSLGAGSEDSIYFEFGTVLAEHMKLAEAAELSIHVVSTECSVDNRYELRNGVLDMAIVQNDIAYYVYEGSHGHQSFQEFSYSMSRYRSQANDELVIILDRRNWRDERPAPRQLVGIRCATS